MVLAAVLAAGLAIPLTLPSAAHAAGGWGISSAQHEVIVTAPKGTNWTVPAGTDVGYVGLRGGDGGNAAWSTPGARGDTMVLRVAVREGDVLTVFAGQPATGKTSDQRDGGLEYINGGTGGTGSVDQAAEPPASVRSPDSYRGSRA